MKFLFQNYLIIIIGMGVISFSLILIKNLKINYVYFNPHKKKKKKKDSSLYTAYMVATSIENLMFKNSNFQPVSSEFISNTMMIMIMI